MNLFEKFGKEQPVPTPQEVAATPLPAPVMPEPPKTSTLADKVAGGGSFNLNALGGNTISTPAAPQVQTPSPVPPAAIAANALESAQALSNVQMAPAEVVTMPEDATEGFRMLVTQLNQHIMAGSDDIEDAIKRVILHAQEHPSLRDNVLPEEIGVIVQACEAMTGRVITKKTANKARSAKQAAADAIADDVLSSIPGLD